MLHSIIVPCRGYTQYLSHLYWSLERSGCRDWDLVVVNEDLPGRPAAPCPPRGYCIEVELQGEYFNKPRLLNIGIENARGDVLTFLDADSIVGFCFLETAPRLLEAEYAGVTKFCYRVRYLPPVALLYLDQCRSNQDKATLVDQRFAKWPSFDRAFEGYGEPHLNIPENRIDPAAPVFGNSQFSIRRDVLGGIRFDEQYAGRGYEDVELNRRLWRHYGDRYKALMMTDAAHALFHIRNPYQGEVWGPGEQNSQNAERYFST